MQQLHEQYRPTSLADVIGHDRVKRELQAIGRRGYGGRSYWITGRSGTGKTTIAKILASEIADPMNIIELVGRELTVATLKDIEHNMRYMGFGNKNGHAYIVNESHGISRNVVERLLNTLESVPDHVMFIFTTTIEGQLTFEGLPDSSPLLSRCILLELDLRGIAKEMAHRVKEIAQAEGLDGQTDATYLRLINDCKSNMRAALQAVESGKLLAA